jgi:hypothetical protein
MSLDSDFLLLLVHVIMVAQGRNPSLWPSHLFGKHSKTDNGVLHAELLRRQRACTAFYSRYHLCSQVPRGELPGRARATAARGDR